MKINKTNLEGVFEIENNVFEDQRGRFVKTFHSDMFLEAGLNVNFKESFYSLSHKNILRGMHFQHPPHDHNKLVYVVSGRILDVALDIRQESKTYGQYYTTELSSDNAKSLYMSKGIAHGFLTLSDSACVVYMTTSVYAPKHDDGIHWDSFGFNWGVNNPIISERDSSFGKLL